MKKLLQNQSNWKILLSKGQTNYKRIKVIRIPNWPGPLESQMKNRLSKATIEV